MSAEETSAPVVLHLLGVSHPSLAAARALELKGIEFERVEMTAGRHNEEMEALYGEGRRTVPGMLFEGEPVHGSRAIFEHLDRVAPEPPLYPDPIADAVRAADAWGDSELQDLGRRLPWGALHFRPEALGTFGGAGPLDPAGTDYAIRFARASWKYHGITASRLADDLAGLPAKIERIERFAQEGVIGGEAATAADLQIGSTVRVLLTLGDLRELLAGTAAERIAMRWFAEYPGAVPRGAFPGDWLP